MKKFRLGVPLVLLLLFAGSAYYMFDSRAAVIGQYHTKLDQARESVKNGVLADGIAQYQEVLAIQPSVAIYTEVGDVYLDSENLQEAQNWYEHEFAAHYPNAPEAYEYGIRVSLAAKDYKRAFEAYDQCIKREAASDKVEQLIKPVWYAYELLFGSYEETGPFSSRNGYAAVKSNERWGYVDADAKNQLNPLYQQAGVFTDYAPVVGQDGSACYIDESGNTKISATQFKDKDGKAAQVQRFQPIVDGLVLAYDGKAWAYFDAASYQERFGGYQDATVIANGIGAVTKDGKAWALIGADGQELTGYDYRQAVANERGVICCTNGLFVAQDGYFYLVDKTGKKINSSRYDTAVAFNENSWAAVQKDGKWIFVNESGKEKDLGDFEEAKSFSNGLAAVKSDGLWGYIDLEGNLAIDCIFYGAGAFNSTGVAFVKPTDKEWNALSLYRYHFD